jgi:hypothetical protein
VSTTEELLERKSNCSALENRYYATPLSPQKLTLTSPTSGGRSAGIVRSRTQATEFGFFVDESSEITGFLDYGQRPEF